jgi:hypothetical protein
LNELLLNIDSSRRKSSKLNKERGLTALEEDASTVVGHNALLHLESLLVIATSNSEDVALVSLVVHDFAIDFLAHLLFVEGTTNKSSC